MPRGGSRPGAGRKPSAFKQLQALKAQLKPLDAKALLASIDAEGIIKTLAKNQNAGLRHKVVTDLWDRAYGKPATTLTHEGQVDIKVVIDL